MAFCQGFCNWVFQPPLQLRGVGIYSHGCKQGCFQPPLDQPAGASERAAVSDWTQDLAVGGEVVAADSDGRVGVPVRVLVCGSWSVKGWPDACTGSALCAAGALRVLWRWPAHPGRCALDGVLEEIQPLVNGPVAGDDEAGHPVPVEYEIMEIGGLLGGEPVRAQVAYSGLDHCPEVVVGMDEADSVSRPDGGVAQGLGQENSCPLPPDLPVAHARALRGIPARRRRPAAGDQG